MAIYVSLYLQMGYGKASHTCMDPKALKKALQTTTICLGDEANEWSTTIADIYKIGQTQLFMLLLERAHHAQFRNGSSHLLRE